MASAKTTSGFRESGEYASARCVVISKSQLAPTAADGPEALALGPDGVGPPRHDPLRLLGARVGREIDVAVTGEEVASHEQVANDAPDQVDAMALGGEALRERARLVEHGSQALGDHRCRVH